jgi:hypothetical protein
MAPPPRNPNVLAYNAVRDAATTEEARRVYDGMKASACYRATLCVVDPDCPFYVDCLLAEGGTDGGT